ncbi:MAG: hypothetical protein JWR74_1238 [Polaromonas sp.]|nr:hypothetical protein [Polaromonas sp.]
MMVHGTRMDRLLRRQSLGKLKGEILRLLNAATALAIHDGKEIITLKHLIAIKR